MPRMTPIEVALDCSKNREPNYRINACLALAEIASREALAALAAMLADYKEPPEVRGAASSALLDVLQRDKDIDDIAAKAMLRLIRDDRDISLRRAALECGKNIDGLRATLLQALRDLVHMERDAALRHDIKKTVIELGASDPSAIDLLLESAVTADDPGLRRQAKEAILGLRKREGDSISAWNVATLGGERYRSLGMARRMGLFAPRLTGTIRERLAKALEARRSRGPRPAGALWLPVVIALVAAGVAAWPSFELLSVFAGQPMLQSELAPYITVALLLAAFVGAVCLLPARAVNFSADRQAETVLELRTALLCSCSLALAASITTLFVMWADGQAFVDLIPYLAWVVAGIVCLVSACLLLRAVGIALYSLIEAPSGRFILCVTLTPFVVATVLLLLAVVLWLVGAGADPPYIVTFLPVVLPAAIGLLVGYLFIDSREPDALPLEPARWRWPVLAAGVVPGAAVLAVALVGLNQITMPSTITETARAGQSGRQELAANLFVNSDYGFAIEDYPQEIVLGSKTLAAFQSDVTLSAASSAPIEHTWTEAGLSANLTPETYVLRLTNWSGFSPEGLTLDETAARIVHLFDLGMRSLLRRDESMLKAGGPDTSGIVEVAWTFNNRDIKGEDFARAKQVKDEIDRLPSVGDAKSRDPAEVKLSDSAAARRWELAVVGAEADPRYAIGSLLMRTVGGEGPATPWLPVQAWEISPFDDVRSDELRMLERMPDHAGLEGYALVNRVWAPKLEERTQNALGIRIDAKVSEDGPPSIGLLLPADEEPGSYAIYLGGDAGAPVAVGTLLRHIATRDAFSVVEIIGGKVTVEDPRYVELRRDTLASLDGGFADLRAVAETVLAHGGQEHLRHDEERRELVDVTMPEEQPAWDEAALPADLGALPLVERLPSLTIARVQEDRAAWLDIFDIDSSADEPPQFRHFFMLATDGNSFPAGSIVSGNNWDHTGNPGFELVYGWGPRSGASNWEYLTNLTYLGASYDPAWEALASEVNEAVSEHKASGEPFRLADVQ
jgi:hypothetical protein